MKRNISNRIKKVAMATIAGVINIVMASPIYAATSGIENLPLFNGTMNLLTAITAGITAIAGSLGLIFCIKSGIEWNAANEQEKPGKQKALIGTIISAVVVTAIPGIVTWILSYY